MSKFRKERPIEAELLADIDDLETQPERIRLRTAINSCRWKLEAKVREAKADQNTRWMMRSW